MFGKISQNHSKNVNCFKNDKVEKNDNFKIIRLYYKNQSPFPKGSETLSAPPLKMRSRKTDAQKIRTRRHVQTLETPTLPLRRLHVASKVSSPTFRITPHLLSFRFCTEQKKP